MEYLEKPLLILFGWLLGLLAPAIVDFIRKHREATEVRIAILPELHELQHRLTMTIYLIENRYGEVNREFIEWMRPVMEGYHGVSSVEDSLKFIEFKRSLTDEQFAESAQIAQLSRDKGLTLRKHHLPLLESKIASLVWFDKTLRGQLLEIKTRMEGLNEGVDENRYLLNLTFQNNISEENYRAVQENITRTCKAYATQARIVVDIIGKIMID